MQSLASGPNHAYKIASANRQQWYILEYRNNSDTFDSSIPGRGMLIWRYNEDPDADNADFDFFDTPHLLWLFRPNSAVDTINGTISSAAFGVYGRNTFNASSNPHPYLADGTPDSSFSLTNIQVSSDHNTVSFTFVPNNNYGCRAVAAMPLVQDFETGSEGCWFSTSITTSNTDRQGVHSSLDGYPTHGGQYSYRFSSYHSSSDYNQYLISPSLPSANPLHLTFYYRRSHTANEQFRVTYSTTTDAPSAFTDTLTDITVTNAGWHLCDLLVPQEAKYIAINYYANYLYYLYIDDISLTDTLTTPSDTIVRDTTYIYLHDTLTLLVHDTLYHHATDTLYYTITDTLYNIIRDTLLTTPERTVLTVASDDPVRGIATGSGTFPIGCTVEIAALPNTGYYFAQWQDGNRDNPRTITVAPDETYTAYFFINGSPTTKEAENTLTEIHDTIILRDTTWIELHDTTWLTHCDTLWIPYPVHDTLWIDHHEVVELDTTTYFTLTAYPLQEGTGIVAGNGVYPVGTVVELAAIPAEGYEFFCWSNGSHENHIQVLIDEDKRLIAAFDEILGTDPVASTTIKAYVENGALVVEAPAGEAITVYNAVGQQMYHSAGSQSYGEINQTVRIPSLHPGFYAVRTGNGSVKKVIIL
ncbi:MAG: choice-of-anchor J domain-containing protein, partial [Bacteroidales bacterium]|nr:choice-of-anchor J domain-containing protein [Bacteroidales bacterium]